MISSFRPFVCTVFLFFTMCNIPITIVSNKYVIIFNITSSGILVSTN
nr:MAG TPA: hypothetical protein [Crassvirales sp.]